jgi:hypothetical protein
MMLLGCSLPALKTADLVQNIPSLSTKEKQIQLVAYCTMGFINPEIKQFKYYDEDEKRFKKRYDIYILKKCALVLTNDELILLSRKGSEITPTELIRINKSDLEGIGVYVSGKYRLIELKVEDKTVALELLNTNGFPDAETAEMLFKHLRSTGVNVFDVERIPVAKPPAPLLFHW